MLPDRRPQMQSRRTPRTAPCSISAIRMLRRVFVACDSSPPSSAPLSLQRPDEKRPAHGDCWGQARPGGPGCRGRGGCSQSGGRVPCGATASRGRGAVWPASSRAVFLPVKSGRPGGQGFLGVKGRQSLPTAKGRQRSACQGPCWPTPCPPARGKAPPALTQTGPSGRQWTRR